MSMSFFDLRKPAKFATMVTSMSGIKLWTIFSRYGVIPLQLDIWMGKSLGKVTWVCNFHIFYGGSVSKWIITFISSSAANSYKIRCGDHFHRTCYYRFLMGIAFTTIELNIPWDFDIGSVFNWKDSTLFYAYTLSDTCACLDLPLVVANPSHKLIPSLLPWFRIDAQVLILWPPPCPNWDILCKEIIKLNLDMLTFVIAVFIGDECFKVRENWWGSNLIRISLVNFLFYFVWNS